MNPACLLPRCPPGNAQRWAILASRGLAWIDLRKLTLSRIHSPCLKLTYLLFHERYRHIGHTPDLWGVAAWVEGVPPAAEIDFDPRCKTMGSCGGGTPMSVM
jgi:hypothetical protein